MDLKKRRKKLRKLWIVSLVSSFVFHAVLCCSLPCPLSPWEAFGLLSFYRIVIVYRFIVIVIEIPNFFRFDPFFFFIERYIESFGTISSTNGYCSHVFPWPPDNVSQLPRQVAGTPRPPSQIRKVHAILPSDYVPSHITFSFSQYVALKTLLPGARYFSGPPATYLRDIPRQVAGTPRPPSPLPVRKVNAVSAFLRRSTFFHSSTRAVQQSGSPRDTPRTRYNAGGSI